MASTELHKLSVIIPILNERKNIKPLIATIHKAVHETLSPYEIIFVDDGSTDGSRDVLDDCVRKDSRVHKLFRTGHKSLSQSVLDGFSIAKGKILIVMDGDLQHDPKYIPLLYASCMESDGISLASRYIDEGKGFARNSPRDMVSRFSTMLVRVLLRVKVSDPMTGFFAVRRTVFDKIANRLSGVGYKILLEIIYYSRASGVNARKIGEVPFVFAKRSHGESKASVKIFYQFLCQVMALLLRIKSVEFMSFCIVGTIGVVVHLAVLNIALLAGFNFHLANIFALIIAATHNYVLNLYFTFSDIRESPHTQLSSWILYLLASGVSMIANTSVASAIHTTIGWVNIASICGIIVGIIWNYSVGRYLLKS